MRSPQPQELLLPRGRKPVPTRTRLRSRRVPVTVYVAALLLLPALLVAGFMGSGWWATTGKVATSPVAAAGPEAEGLTGSTAAPAVPADVKGSMTVQQVVDAFPPVTAAEILARFGAPLDTLPSTQLKTLVESGDGTDIPGLRTWLQARTGG